MARQGCVCRRELVAMQGEESGIKLMRSCARGGEMQMGRDGGYRIPQIRDDGRMHDRISLGEMRR